MSYFRKKLALGIALAFSVCASPTMARAAIAVHSPSINPLATISVFGSPAATSVLCSSNAAVVAAAQAAPGCVLPVVDPAPLPPPAQPVALPPPPPPATGIGLLPILLGVAGIIGLALLIASQNDDDDDDDVPVSAP